MSNQHLTCDLKPEEGVERRPGSVVDAVPLDLWMEIAGELEPFDVLRLAQVRLAPNGGYLWIPD